MASDGKGGTKIKGWKLIMQQFFAIIIKRFVYIRRNWKGLFSQVNKLDKITCVITRLMFQLIVPLV